ncbi:MULTISPECIES: hypothetical protein [unclassified Agrococcus]|uniref:hypothetical protein n=1 Tax=unclassified Agrococcus TaxID=2615065 RepID=UPI00361D22E9
MQRDARGLQPSVELPWSPPWSVDLGEALVDLLADVSVLQADVASAATWLDDEDARRRRSAAIDAAVALRARCATHGFTATAHALHEIASSLRAWEALGA